MADPPRLEMAEILDETSALIGARAPSFLMTTIAYMAFGIWADSQIWSWNAEMAIACAAALLGGLLQYIVLRRALGDDGGGGFGAIRAAIAATVLQFGIWLLAGLGYILLVLPGLYLAARMSAAVGMVVAERAGLIGSISGSWHRTRRSVWPLMTIHALLLVPLLAMTGLIVVAWYAGYGTGYVDEESVEFTVLTNLVFAVLAMVGWAVTGAVYRLTAPERMGHDEIFA